MDQQSISFKRFLATVRSPWFGVLVLLFCVFSYFFIDRQLSLYIYSAISSGQYQFAKLVTKLGLSVGYLIILPLLFLTFKFIFRSPRWARICLFLFLAVALPSLICDVVKMVIGRTRPELLLTEHMYQFVFFKVNSDYWSFPSGHSTVITGFMLGMCFVFNRYWLLFIGLFLLVSASRVFMIAHYLSDVVAGMYLSILVVPWIFQRWFAVPRPSPVRLVAE